MSEIVCTSRIPIPDDCKDPIGELVIFLRVNGYKSQTEPQSLTATRGKKGKGFWTSDLTILPTQLNIVINESFAELEYKVITTGQILNTIEGQFWKREAAAAGAFLAGEPVENFKDSQRFQAEEIRAKFLRRGMNLAIFTAFFLFVVGFFLLK